jgi:hypothetical protein
VNRSPLDRAQRIIDKLDTCCEAQTFLPGSDYPSAVAIVASFTHELAHAERQLAQLRNGPTFYMRNGKRHGVALLPILRRLIRSLAASRRLLAQHRDECRGVADPAEARIARAQGGR